MTDWQPIKTAPRDGSTIIAWGRYNSEPAMYRWYATKKRWDATHDGEHVIESQSDLGTEYKAKDEITLSYWMPVPCAPKDDK